MISIKTFLIMALIIVLTSGCAMFNKKDFNYTTRDGVTVKISNDDLRVFMRSVQAVSSGYQTVQKKFLLDIDKAELRGDTERADGLYNKFKPIDDMIMAGFEGLAASTSTTLTIAEELKKKQISVPKVLINHAGDILLLMGRLIPLAEEFGIDLPPAFDVVLEALGVLSV